MKTIQIDPDIQAYLVASAVEPGESASRVLRRGLGLAPPPNAIEIDDELYSYLASKTVDIGESASQILRRELHLGEAPAPGPAIVVFHIPAGTTNQPWNTAEHAVVATVGDTLRVVNDDGVSHRLHTNGTPFPHPDGDIPPAQSADYLLKFAFGPGPQALYDHNFGATAKFWIVVRPAP